MATTQRYLSQPVGVALTVILVVAALLRVHDIRRAAVSHFDEGVYASSALRLSVGADFYHGQEYHAPPGYPFVVSVAFRLLGGPSATVAFLVSTLAGVGTCALLFVLGRWLFGPGVGLAAAGLLAVNDFHISLCKSALVDAQFTLLFTGGLGLLYLTWVRPQVRLAVASGLVVGAAWLTKYNGFLPLAIMPAAIVLEAVRRRWRSTEDTVPPLKRALALWALSAGVALLCYLPWALHLHNTLPDGYASLTVHQRQYLRDWSDWLGHARELLSDLAVFRHVGTAAALAGLIAVVVWALRSRRVARRWTLAGAAAALAGSVYAGVEAVYLAAALCGIGFALTRGGRGDRFLAVWALALLVMTPLYTPYVRLVSPLLPALILLAVRWVTVVLAAPTEPVPRRAQLERVVGLVLVMALASVGGKLLGVPFARWQSAFAARGGYAQAAAELDGLNDDALITFHAQPSFYFYRPDARRVDDSDFVIYLQMLARRLGKPTYLVVDFILANNREARRSVDTHERQLAEVARFENDLSLLQLLDQHDADRFWDYLRDPDTYAAQQLRTIRIYRVRTD